MPEFEKAKKESDGIAKNIGDVLIKIGDLLNLNNFLVK